MKIKCFKEPENLKSDIVNPFITSVIPDISDDDLEHYEEELFNILNGEEIVTNDQNLIGLMNIFQECIYAFDSETIRLVCNNLIADIKVEFL